MGHNDVIWDYDIIIVTSELMIPFPTIIYEPILIPSILTWSLCDMCVCVCVCVSQCVCLSVQAITFEPVDIETSFLLQWYILPKSRSSSSIKVIGLRSRSFHGKG